MWPYTHDESNWLAIVDVLETTRPRPLDPPSIAEIERAARRLRSRMIAGWLKDTVHGAGRLLRAVLYRRRRAEAKPPPGGVVAAD